MSEPLTHAKQINMKHKYHLSNPVNQFYANSAPTIDLTSIEYIDYHHVG